METMIALDCQDRPTIKAVAIRCLNFAAERASSLCSLLFPRFRELARHPIFVVGCGHSGTTLLVKIIGRHPGFLAPDHETGLFIRKKHFLLFFYEWQAFWKDKNSWVEKSPSHIHFIEEIFRLRPGAKVIIVLRDGRDVALSIKNRTGCLETGIHRWLNDNSAGEPWWQDSRVMLVKYEDFISSPEDKLGEIMAFAGSSLDPRQLQSTDSAPDETKPENGYGTNHDAYRQWQTSKPLFDGRKKWIKGLSPDEIEKIKGIANQRLIKYGYESSCHWLCCYMLWDNFIF